MYQDKNRTWYGIAGSHLNNKATGPSSESYNHRTAEKKTHSTSRQPKLPNNPTSNDRHNITAYTRAISRGQQGHRRLVRWPFVGTQESCHQQSIRQYCDTSTGWMSMIS